MKRAPLAPLALSLLVACSSMRPAPVVQEQSFAQLKTPITRVAVVPFTPTSKFQRAAAASDVDVAEVSAAVSRLVTEAIGRRGVAVIPASDLALVFTSQGRAVPALDAVAAAEIAAQQFGATGVVLGQVDRFRDRTGDAIGSTGAASVAIVLTLYEAPSAAKVWSARFDETQKPLTANLFNLPRYPGGGSRWLTATELARWGAEEAALRMPLTP